MSKKPFSIYVICGNASFNKGDRANLFSQLTLIRQEFPQASITIDSLRPEIDSEWFPVDSIVSRKGLLFPFRQIKAIHQCSLIVWGGGALIADNSCRLLIPYWCVIFLIARCMGKNIFGWAHGVVLETRSGKLFSKLILKMVDVMTVRDKGSFNLLKSLNTFTPIHLTADPAILFNPESRERGFEVLSEMGYLTNRRKTAGLSFTFWPFYHDVGSLLPQVFSSKKIWPADTGSDLNKYISAIVSLCNFLADQHGMDLILIPRYSGPPWQDIEILEHIKQVSDHTDRIFIVSDDTYGPKDFFSIWRCLDFHIGTALHDTIIAESCRIPYAHVAYEQKGSDFMESTGNSSRLFAFNDFLNCDSEIFMSIQKLLIQDPDQNKNAGPEASELRMKAAENIRILKDYIMRKKSLDFIS